MEVFACIARYITEYLQDWRERDDYIPAEHFIAKNSDAKKK